MFAETVTLRLPDALYHRLANNARATHRSLEEVLLYALQVGSPPGWEDAPAEFQADLAEMDRLEDEALWRIFHQQMSESDLIRYDALLEKNQTGDLSDTERLELIGSRQEAERLMLRKAHAAVLLRWRGHSVVIMP